MGYLRTSRITTATLALMSLVSSGSACPTYEDYVVAFGPSQHKRDSGNSSSLDKRFWGLGSGSPRKWPDGNLVYCIDPNAANPDRITAGIADGWKLWVDAGVDDNFLSVNVANDCSAANRANYLLITENTMGLLTSGIGKRPAGPNGGGPYMQLDVTSTNAGSGNVAANVAHELGHAFGLVHEQQRPDLWRYPDYPDGDSTSNTFTFNCQNLADYSALERSVPDAAKRDRICHSFDATKQVITQPNGGPNLDFSALNFLPWVGEGFQPFNGPGGDLDEKSIMIYGSYQGALTNPDGTRPEVYTLVGGGIISFNLIPSRRDVNGLNALYNENAKKYGKTLYFLKNSPLFKKFSDTRSSSCS